MKKNKQLEDYIAEVNYTYMNESYVPSIEALEFLTFIKLVNGSQGESHKSPVMHMQMIEDSITYDNCLDIVFRGGAKTSVMHEYTFLYIAVHGSWFRYGEVDVAMYVSDTMDNGVKSMRKQLEYRWENSEFLQKYVPSVKFTDDEWEFTNISGKKFFVKGFGATTGVRGFKRYGKRPTWCGLDDLLSDKNAKSPTITEDIKNVIYKASRQAMDPQKRKVVWTGTPFNKSDPLYSAAGSKMWKTRVFPVCEKFPCAREEFRGAWEDRFDYDSVNREYQALLEQGEIAAFNQELMLRISSEDDRLVQDDDIQWYSREQLLDNKGAFNFYITTDFATSEKDSADYSVISVWAINNKGYWFLVDGICKRQGMDKNIDDLFLFAQKYNPQSVGIEVSGQQGGFIPWLQQEMLSRNIWFSLASDNNSGKAGIRPNKGKLARFQTVVPWFKAKRMFLPSEWETSNPLVVELLEELRYLTNQGFRSAHDDVADTVSMLSVLKAWKPSQDTGIKQDSSGLWMDADWDDEGNGALSSYVV